MKQKYTLVRQEGNNHGQKSFVDNHEIASIQVS